jgi:hypothetical protein
LTARKGKDVGALWATPSTSLPAVSMPKASQAAIAGGASSAAGGGLAPGVVLNASTKSPVLKQAGMVAADICTVSSTACKGKDGGARWANPSTSLPAVSMPEALQTAIAGGAASAAGGGLAHGVVLIEPTSLPVPKRAAMAGSPLCRASVSKDVAAGRAAEGWLGAIPLAPAKALVEARAQPRRLLKHERLRLTGCSLVQQRPLTPMHPALPGDGPPVEPSPIPHHPRQRRSSRFVPWQSLPVTAQFAHFLVEKLEMVDCCTGGMLGASMASTPAGPTSLPTEPASVASPSSSNKSLPSAGMPRAVVDCEGASLLSTERSKAMVDAVWMMRHRRRCPRQIRQEATTSSTQCCHRPDCRRAVMRVRGGCCF